MKDINEVKFDEKGLVPAIAQDITTNQVLMMAYMNKEALEKTMKTGYAHYFSRSRNKLWMKGEESNHIQIIKGISLDCDGDTILLKVEQKEAACHTGHVSCFFRDLTVEGITQNSEQVFDPQKVYGDRARVLQEVYDVIKDRIQNPREGSYTNYLFEKGLDKILKKVGEETAEVIIAAKNKSGSELRYEIADLMYHLMVLMVERGLTLDEVYEELIGRR